MDPSTLINDGSFSHGNAASYNLPEIWQFPMNGGGGGGGCELGVGLGLRRGQFGQNLAQFGDANRDVSGNDPMRLDQRGNHGGGGARKRRDAEEESAKGVSTSSANGNGNSNVNGVVFVFQIELHFSLF